MMHDLAQSVALWWREDRSVMTLPGYLTRCREIAAELRGDPLDSTQIAALNALVDAMRRDTFGV